MENDFYKILVKILDSKDIYLNEDMSKHTSFKTGGKAKFFVKIRTQEKLKEVLNFIKNNKINFFVLGNGTNVLFKDGTFEGVVLQIKLEEIKIDEKVVTVGAGVKNAVLSSKLLKEGLSGFEFASGIPGTIGGAVKMNAGAYGTEFKDIVKTVTYMDLEGNIKTIENNECNFSYRNSIFFNKKVVIVSATLKLEYEDTEKIRCKVYEYSKSRKEKQPLEYPNAGSTFKRGENFITAKIIDECGLKGYRIGGAEVSKKHAGFIINKNGATATDIIKLIDEVKRIVLEKTGEEIKLEIEII